MNVENNYSNDFFEGTEKLLEVWFSRSLESLDKPATGTEGKPCDLRKIPRSAWESLLKLVKCEIISYRKNDFMDAYVLSESSLFIGKNRFILKTCGSTTLLCAVKPLLFLVQELTEFDNVLDVFYSRKNFVRPELQDNLHRTFENEVEVLDNLFEGGAAYCLGRVNQDCWYLYTLNPPVGFGGGIQVPDQTLEVIMQDLDKKVMKLFTREFCKTSREATQRSGIDTLIPGLLIDDFLFDPCGYSMNGLLKGNEYVTIHITPEPHCSYVSFETNIPQECYKELIAKLLRIFRPGRFITTIFANQASIASTGMKNGHFLEFSPYQQKEIQFCRFKNYDLTYALFAKAPS